MAGDYKPISDWMSTHSVPPVPPNSSPKRLPRPDEVRVHRKRIFSNYL